MTTIPKPKHCGQNWLEMNPTDGGRICGQCDKKIVDFSKMSWTEIEQLQRKNNNAVCGMYNPKQLDHWGRDIPTHKDNFIKAATITGLTISLSLSAYSQPTNQTDSVVIKGRVTDKDTGEELPFANVKLKHSNIGTATDIDGNFKLVVSSLPTTPFPDTLEVMYVGYRTTKIIFKDLKEINNTDNEIKLEDGKLNLTLAPATENIIAFYVTKPTLRQRIKWKFQRWFGRKE